MTWPRPDAANGRFYTLHGDLAGWQRSMLESKCREWGIKGFSKMNRKQMQQEILNHPNNSPSAEDSSPG